MQTVLDVAAVVCWILLCSIALVGVSFSVGVIAYEIALAFQ